MKNALIRVPGLAPKSLGFAGPQTDGLLAWHWLGGDENQTDLNFVDDSRGSVSDGVTYDPAFLQATGEAGLTTSLSDMANLTFACVFRREVTLSAPVLIGSRTASVPFTWLFMDAANRLEMRIYRNPGTPVSALSTFNFAGAETWEMAFGSVDDTDKQVRLYVPGRSINVTASYTDAKRNDSGLIRVGFMGDGTGAVARGPVKLAQAAVWNRALTPAQMDECYAFAKARLMDRLGLIVT